MTFTVPHGMPILARGRHRHPADGACLMEATALLAGQPFTDHPEGVHPLIAVVARIVNDAVTGPARQQLLRLAPDIAGTSTEDPDVFDHLVILVCQRALPVALPIWAPAIYHAVRHAQRRRARNQTTLTRWQRRRAAAAVRYAAASLALASHAQRDEQLSALLTDCLTTIHHPDQPNHSTESPQAWATAR
ncbi:MAG: hypothetical protein H0T78_06050 [Longispora sp.]|nr:hypothetical protein [Longispora sp. (in: high G+C Gram-positive bacteria)]